MVTTKQKSTVDTQNIKKNESAYHYRKSSDHKEREQEGKIGTKELQNNQKTMNKVATVSPHLSVSR